MYLRLYLWVLDKLKNLLYKKIAENKKMLVLINPPYAEAGNTLGKESKGDVAKTKIAANIVVKSYPPNISNSVFL